MSRCMTSGPLSHLQPSSIEEELQQSEDGHIEVQVVAWVTLTGVQELAAD